MNVLVCIKQVPDNSVVPKLDPNTNRVVTEGVELMESPFDLNAVEAGLKLVEESGGEVSVLTLGGESAKTSLRYGLSMGAAKAYLLKDPAFEESDSWGTSYGLAKAIQSIGNFDVILCGKQAIDNDAGQVGPGIAEQQFAVAAVSARVVTCQRFGQERVTAAQAGGVIVTVAFNGTTRQHALFRPRRTNALIIWRQFFQRVLRQFAVGGQLTAEYRQQRGFAVFIMDIKGVITGNGLRRVGLIIT